MENNNCPLCQITPLVDENNRQQGMMVSWARQVVCSSCYRGAHDGFNYDDSETLKKIAEEKGLPIPQKTQAVFYPDELGDAYQDFLLSY